MSAQTRKPGPTLATYDNTSADFWLQKAGKDGEEGTSVYDLLFKSSAEATLTIATDPRHLGAKIGITALLHTRAFRRSGRRFAARKTRKL